MMASQPSLSDALPLLIAQAKRRGIARLWIKFERAEIYLRVGPLDVFGQEVECLQIANVVTPESDQGKGGFKRFLQTARALTDLPFYVERVVNPRFAAGLPKHGFQMVKCDASGSPSFVRFK